MEDKGGECKIKVWGCEIKVWGFESVGVRFGGVEYGCWRVG